MEVWLDIDGYDGAYQVSNEGRVRTFLVKNGQVGYKRSSKPKSMTLNGNGNGYLYVSLCKSGKRKNAYIHRLVAEAFIRKTQEGEVVNHIDFNKHNNRVENLEIVTQRENVEHSRHHLCKPKERNEMSYIRFKKGGYEVCVNRHYVGRFQNIEDAKEARDGYIKEINYY